MELLTGFGHHFFRRDSYRPARADFVHPCPDFLVPSGLDFGRDEALDAGEDFLHKFNPARGRPFQDVLRERLLCSRHGWIIALGRAFGKDARGQADVPVSIRRAKAPRASFLPGE